MPSLPSRCQSPLFPAEVESRTQGSRPRPRTQKKSEAKAKDSLSEDRHSRGQGQECSRPRPRNKDTSASAFQKKKKKVFTKIFQAISTKKRFPKIFQALHKILTIQKIVLSSSRGQANFRKLEASRPRPRPRTSKCVLKDSTSNSQYPNWRRHISHFHLNFQVPEVSSEELLLSRPIRCELSRLRCHGHSLLLSSYLHRISRKKNSIGL